MKHPLTQKAEVLWHYLNVSSSLTKLDSFKKYGILHVGAIICSLRKSGVVITTKAIKRKNKFGRPIEYADYVCGTSKKALLKLYKHVNKK